MMHLLRIEWLKLRRYRAFTTLLMIVAAAIFGLNYIMYSTITSFGTGGGDPHTTMVGRVVMGRPFEFPEVFATVAYFSSFMLIVAGMVMILAVCNEYSYRTHRQNVIDGLSRTQFITGKILLLVILALGLTMVVFLAALLFGSTGRPEFSFDGIEYVGYFLIQALSYMSVAMVIAILVRRTGIAMGIYFVYALIAENVLSSLLHHRVYEGSGSFFPLESADKLIPVPTMVGQMLKQNGPDTGYLIAVAIIWIGVCLWFCKYRFEKSDL